jgi:predicted dehydrogenase
MEKLRLAVIGVGAYESSRARGYLATIARLADEYHLCALCDHSREALKAVGAQYQGAAVYSNAQEILAKEKPDVVFCLVPTDGQTLFALTAARQKAHVITEIPYALTLAMGDAIDRTCRENGLKWEIAENVWLWPHERLKQQIIQAGLLGEITHARLWYASGCYHGFNAIRTLLGREPTRVLGYAGTVSVPPYTNYGGEPETTRVWESGALEFPGGVICLYEMPPLPGARGSHWEIEGTQGYLAGNGLNTDELVLYKDDPRKVYPFRDAYEEIGGKSVLASVSVETDPPIIWENPFKSNAISAADDVAKASILRSLHRAVTENTEPAYGAANARRDMELWFAVRESARRENVWIDLPLAGPTELEERLTAAYIQRYGHDPLAETNELLDASFNRLSVMWTAAGWL